MGPVAAAIGSDSRERATDGLRHNEAGRRDGHG